jgi:hypothetical protein
MIERIKKVSLREIWKHEAYDFTTWLESNIDVLNDVLDISISGAEREQAAGNFNVDILAEDEMSNPVIIENQLEKSNHDHLGKLITYLTAIDARIAIWIVADPRPEHVNAITWLNESASADFYLLKLEGIKIGDSEPAPLLTLIVGPSEETREVGAKKKEMAERSLIRHEFGKELLKRAKEKTKLHSQISPGRYNWLGTSAGKRGLNYNYAVRQHSGQVEVYIDRGKDAEEENKEIFNKLKSHKKEIEDNFGEKLNWDLLESRRACRISKEIKTGGYRDKNMWNEIHDEMIDAMCRLEKATKPVIKKIRL